MTELAKPLRLKNIAIATIALTLCHCGQLAPPILNRAATGAARNFLPTSLGTGYRFLYSFRGGRDGGAPSGPLAPFNGALYGTANLGGIRNNGTIFKVDSSGTESVIYRFKGSLDGSNPSGGLTVVQGALYGATSGGGNRACECGTIFKVTPSGQETVVYRFKGIPDGSAPMGPLIAVRGSLFGTTDLGGTGTQGHCAVQSKIIGCGTIFKVSLAGNEQIVLSFNGNETSPNGGLLDLHNILYGTLREGGNTGHGLVFGISKLGKAQLSYNFQGSPDGAIPVSSLILYNGFFYGTTYSGGQGCAEGCGTVFKIDAAGNESVVYAFQGGNDGELPGSGLLNVDGTLYGTTQFGGGSADCGESGCGTVFGVTSSGHERVLYSFSKASIGAEPAAPLIKFHNRLYGTTMYGGREGCGQGSFPFDGCGTIFSVTPTVNGN